jgi:hypothetical protein
MHKLIIICLLSIILTGCATYTDLMYLGNDRDRPVTTEGHVRYFLDDLAGKTWH